MLVSDLPSCMQFPKQKAKDQPKQKYEPSELSIWSINAHGLSTETKMQELREEPEQMEPGVVLLQETWRKASGESFHISAWRVCFSGSEPRPRGSSTGIAVRQSLLVQEF